MTDREKVERESGRLAEKLESGMNLTRAEKMFGAALVRLGIDLADEKITEAEFYEEAASMIAEEKQNDSLDDAWNQAIK